VKSGSPIGDHTGLRQGKGKVQRGFRAGGNICARPREKHAPRTKLSRIGVTAGGEEPQKGKELSRERSHFLGGMRL